MDAGRCSYYDGTMPTLHGRGEGTRAQIINAAIRDFAQYGYDGTGVAEICKSAGISKGAFYHHFESKETLYLELLNEWLRSIDDELRSIRARSSSTLEALVEMTRVFRSIFDSSRVKVAVFLDFLTKAAREPGLREAALEPYRRYQRYFTEMIAQGAREGSIRDADPQQTAQLLVSTAVGLVLQGVLDPEAADWGSVAENAVTLFIRRFIAR